MVIGQWFSHCLPQIGSILAAFLFLASSLWDDDTIAFFWSVIWLREVSVSDDIYYGAKLVLFVCLIVWAADTGAYFAGKWFGRYKMAPSVSPNKTLEGLAGGILTSILVAIVFAHWFRLQFATLPFQITVIFVTAIASVLGDLVESMFKREAKIKDSSQILPGHGGVLDRIDSLTAAFPIFALCYFVF